MTTIHDKLGHLSYSTDRRFISAGLLYDDHWNRQIKTNLEQLRPLPKKVREDGSA